MPCRLDHQRALRYGGTQSGWRLHRRQKQQRGILTQQVGYSCTDWAMLQQPLQP